MMRAAPAVAPPRLARIDGIDLLRGLVIVFMVIDHARDYAGMPGRLGDPMVLDTTSPLLFTLRWLAHFCAPIFTCLAGLSMGLTSSTLPLGERMRHMALRGAVLILLEFTLVDLSWTFWPWWPIKYAQVIWGIGASLLVLALVQPLPSRLRLAIGVACLFGHNLLDGWHPREPVALQWGWAILHDRQVLPLWEGMSVRTSYPILPMIGLVLVGAWVGSWMRGASPARVPRMLTWAGLGMLALFVLLRVTNLYGDSTPAEWTGSAARQLMSLLNVTKYPMSLSFVLMTLGAGSLLLARVWTSAPAWTASLQLLGRVPMFVYVGHLYLLHLIALAWAWLQGFRSRDFDFMARIGGVPVAFGFPLWQVIPFALVTVLVLLPAARWYDRLRASRRYAITRYF
jgi:uncharacterized membrane protein